VGCKRLESGGQRALALFQRQFWTVLCASKLYDRSGEGALAPVGTSFPRRSASAHEGTSALSIATAFPRIQRS
jgi:hypothetical protein